MSRIEELKGTIDGWKLPGELRSVITELCALYEAEIAWRPIASFKDATAKRIPHSHYLFWEPEVQNGRIILEPRLTTQRGALREPTHWRLIRAPIGGEPK